jgi:hypothetical protein
MAFDREDKKAPQEMDTNPVFAFDKTAISLNRS